MTAPATAIRLPDNKFLLPAVDALPGYKAALDRADRADEMLRELAPPAPVAADLDPRNTGPTLEWLDALDEHDTAVERYERHRRRLLGSKQAAMGEAASVLRANANRLLAGLNDHLTELLHEVAEIADELDGAITADQAIGHGVAPAWKALAELVGEYAELRFAQEYCLNNLTPNHYWTTCKPVLGGEATASVAHLRNIDALWPGWRNPNANTQINIVGSKKRAEPWPSDPTQLLLWLVTSEAEPWIPTTTQIDELFAEKRDRDNPKPTSPPQRDVLNQPPRPPTDDYYSRVITPLETSTPPIDIDLIETAEGK